MSDPTPPVTISSDDLKDLMFAKKLLENPGLTARLADVVGTPIEKGFAMLPEGWAATVQKAVRSALFRGLELAVTTINPRSRKRGSEFLHKVMVGASGGVGGALGLPALIVELPISTTIMLRSIADIARTEGHNLNDIRTKLDCLEVFALGGRSKTDDATDSSYWAVRAALSRAVAEAASYFAEKGVLEKTAPAVARLVSAIASRFGVVVSEQVAAKAVPIVGAAGGSLVNVLFMDHFQAMARGHFIVRRLERKYGSAAIREAYDSIAMPFP
ncbi:MAG: EcsC family protein [Verrucomicrobiota bacterium]